MTITSEDWTIARTVVRRALRSTLHCSIASTNPDGSAQVTPIGSVLLNGVGSGLYFDIFNKQLAANVDRDPRITIVAVDAGRIRWLRSLLRGRFASPPGVRLSGTVGPARPSTPEEVARFHRIAGPLLRTRGGRLMWSRLPRVRDVTLDQVSTLSIGRMT